jgi:hypothetical protein
LAIAGSLITRVAWIRAGHQSAQDWKLPLENKNLPQTADLTTAKKALPGRYSFVLRQEDQTWSGLDGALTSHP